MTDKPTPTKPHGATLHLGGDAWAHADLAPLLTPRDTITPYPNNPRRGDQDAITTSITDHGLYAGVIAQRSTGHILIGNHRFHALTHLGAEQVPVTWLDVDDTRAAAIVARDNLTSDRGGYDDQGLLDLLTTLQAADSLDLSGYAEEDVADLVALMRAPDIADLAASLGSPTDEDRLVTIKVRVSPDTAALWHAAAKAVHADDPVAIDTALVEAVHAHLVKRAGK